MTDLTSLEEDAICYTHPASLQPQSGYTPEAAAFQRSVALLDAWPLEDEHPITKWDVLMGCGRAVQDAETEYLNDLANW